MRTARVGRALPALPLLLLAAAGSRGASAAAAPAPLAVSASLEPAAIRVGDAVRLTATVDHPAGWSVALPELERGRAIVVTDRKSATAALADGRERTTLVVLLTSFEVGEHRVGSGEIRAAAEGGPVVTGAPFPGATLRVNSLLAGEDTPMRGAKGVARWPAPIGRWAGLAAGLLLMAGLAVLGVRVLRARRRRGTGAAAPPPSPQETALRALAALRPLRPIPQELVEPWYRELSSIARSYLEERFGLKAPERTTEEFIREAAGSGLLAPVHQELVRAFLEQCDLVKFARHLPPQDDTAAVLAAAERLVRET